MAESFRRCAVAPKHHLYKYCPKCGHGDPDKTFMFAFCSENCRDIFQVCDEYARNRMSAAEAKKTLSGLDITDIKHFGESYQRYIAEILCFEEEKKEVIEQEVPTVEEIPVVEEIQTVEETSAVEEVPVTPKRNRKRFVNDDLMTQ